MADDTDSALSQQRGLTPWQPGQSGNPKGRDKGSRNKLGEAFLDAMHADFAEHGPSVIETVRTEKPDQYLKVIASILPKEMHVKVSDLDGLNDEQLDERIAALLRRLDDPSLSGGAAEREGTPPVTH